MLYLLLSIVASTSLVFIFKLFQRFGVHTFQAIVINYLTCVVVGFLFSGGTGSVSAAVLEQPWVIHALVLGTIFIGTFYLIALTTHKVGVTAASVATKISLVIPVLFSLLVLKKTMTEISAYLEQTKLPVEKKISCYETILNIMKDEEKSFPWKLEEKN